MEVVQSMLAQLGINQSFFVMFGLFFATYIVIDMLAIQKLSATLVERDNRMEGREHESDHIEQELAKARETIEVSMREARVQGATEFQKIKMKANEEQRAIVGKARESVQGDMKKSREALAAKLTEESRKMETEIPQLAKMIVDKLVNMSSQKNLSRGAE